MKCPLLVAGNNAQPVDARLGPEACLKLGCVWWDKAQKDCSITTQKHVLADIGEYLRVIACKRR